MALTNLPYPNMDFVPLDILTADELDQIVANIEAVNNAMIGTNSISNLAITGAKIADGAITGAKIADGAVDATKMNLASLQGEADVADGIGLTYLGKAILTTTATQLDFNIPTTYDNYKVLAKLTYVSASSAWLDLRMLDSGGTAIKNYHQVQRVTNTTWGCAINQDVSYAINSTGGTGDQAINLDMTITRSGTSWVTYQAELDVGAGAAFTTNRAYGRIATATSPSTLRLISNSTFAVGGWIKVWGWNN